MVVYLARHVVYLNRVVVIGMGNIGMSNIGMSNIGMSSIGMSNIGMSNIGMSTGAYCNVKSPDFPLHHFYDLRIFANYRPSALNFTFFFSK